MLPGRLVCGSNVLGVAAAVETDMVQILQDQGISSCLAACRAVYRQGLQTLQTVQPELNALCPFQYAVPLVPITAVHGVC